MKKVLLIAAAALVTIAANAQIASKIDASKPQSQTQLKHQYSLKSYQMLPAKNVGKPVLDKTSKQFKAKDLKNLVNLSAKANKAAEVQSQYIGYGSDRDNGSVTWSTYTSVAEDQSLLIKDVIPNSIGLKDGITVKYTFDGSNIIIAPQLVASSDNSNSPTGKIYIYLLSGTSEDGTITLTVDETGHITGSYDIFYGVYSANTLAQKDYLGYYSYVSNVRYYFPGEEVAPVPSFEASSLVLFAGLGLNGYSYNSNLAITGAYAPTSFRNLTVDPATAWNWSVKELVGSTSAGEPITEPYAQGTDRDFTFTTVGGTEYTDIQLVGINGDKVSDPFTFGAFNSIDSESGNFNYTGSYLYAGAGEDNFILNNETPAIITRQNPDGDLAFYRNWATPDIADYNMSKIYVYHEKPSTPLYITGVTLPVVNFANNNIDLHIKIQKVDYPLNANRPTLGEVIAEGDVTNINEDYTNGLVGIEFGELYAEDELGFSSTIENLFIDTEFVIVIEGWNNGSFSGVLGSQSTPLNNARTSTWFEMSGEEGSLYSYTAWRTSLFVGLMGATYGYLYTEDDTNIVIPAEGGETSINIHPMYSNADGAATKTRIFLDENSEIPEWLTVGFANEDYDDTFTFDLVFKADALPEGVNSRSAELTFWQEGAKLTVSVVQGSVDEAVNAVKATTKTNVKFYSLDGREMKEKKGIAVSNGKKFIVR